MPRPHWIRSEKSRTLLSGVLLVVAAVAGGGLALVLDLTENHSLWFALLLGYSIYGSVHALFIVLAFRVCPARRWPMRCCTGISGTDVGGGSSRIDPY